jgi:hypothetical protein
MRTRQEAMIQYLRPSRTRFLLFCLLSMILSRDRLLAIKQHVHDGCDITFVMSFLQQGRASVYVFLGVCLPVWDEQVLLLHH